MKEKSHRAAQGCYRSGSETFLRPNARRLDGYSLYTDKPEFEHLSGDKPSSEASIRIACCARNARANFGWSCSTLAHSLNAAAFFHSEHNLVDLSSCAHRIFRHWSGHRLYRSTQ